LQFQKLQEVPAPTQRDRILFSIQAVMMPWCRDHGPAFIECESGTAKVVIDWGYNAWGNKYPPYELDDVIPKFRIADHFSLLVFNPGTGMEGGSSRI